MKEIRVKTPLSDEVVEGLKAGDKVLLSGVVFGARDATHERMFQDIDEDRLPLDLEGAVIYYVGPTPTPPGKVIGAAGPTTSSRMDSYMPRLLSLGLKATIGKGYRSREVMDAMVKHGAVYFIAVGGLGALLSKSIVKSEVVAYEDLGPQALFRLELRDFPVLVAYDIGGNSIFEAGVRQYRR
ncbi:MAG: Fe-S-containing hydro-lyase [Candidatus Hydrothermarchaeales archaeon]